MLRLDPSHLPETLATTLMLRGAQVPPLDWSVNPSRLAKETLDQQPDDATLLGDGGIADESAAAAVRALLYLWNGWLSDANMYAQAAAEPDQLYIAALVARHESNPAEAKQIYQQLETHPTFAQLYEYVAKEVDAGTDSALLRWHQIVQLGEAWEAFAFADLIEQARAEKLRAAAVLVVRQVQCIEFELLFSHTYEAATGRKAPLLSTPVDPQQAPRKRPRPKPTPRRAPSPAPPTRSEGAAKSPPPAQPKKPPAPPAPLLKPNTFGVACPKCKHVVPVRESARGQAANCPKCGVAFRIPGKAPAKT
jgi:hypothetical protein